MAEKDLEVGALTASLDELVRAADATSTVRKALDGVAIDQGGHGDERGNTSGGYPERGDIGGLDDMMIGKMQGTLAQAGFSSSQIAAFMSQDEDLDEGEENAEENEELEGKADGTFATHDRPMPKMSGKKSKKAPAPPAVVMGKSMDAFRADADLSEQLDVSPFLESLTARTAEQLDSVNKSIRSVSARQDTVSKAMASALYEVGTLVKSQAAVINELGKRLNLVERQPAPSRGAQTVPQAKALHKAFSGEAGAPVNRALTKSEVLSTLSYMNLEKSMKEIGGQSTFEIIGQIDSGTIVPMGVQAANHFIATHPNEAEAARSYK